MNDIYLYFSEVLCTPHFGVTSILKRIQRRNCLTLPIALPSTKKPILPFFFLTEWKYIYSPSWCSLVWWYCSGGRGVGWGLGERGKVKWSPCCSGKCFFHGLQGILYQVWEHSLFCNLCNCLGHTFFLIFFLSHCRFSLAFSHGWNVPKNHCTGSLPLLSSRMEHFWQCCCSSEFGRCDK